MSFSQYGDHYLFKDIFLYHWKEESQHAILDEMELRRHHATLSPADIDQSVTDFIDLVAAVDGILQAQAAADAAYFADTCGRMVGDDERTAITARFLAAYRWQYIHSGATHPKFVEVMSELITPDQADRIGAALETLQ